MPATARSLDYSTPEIVVIEPRGLIVRKIMYCRNVAGGETETRVTRQVYNHAAQQVANWDPRLLKLAESQPDTKANLTSRFTMTGASLFTDSVDAGWRLALMNDAGGACRNWDSRGTQRHTEYDFQLRPVAVIEHEKGGEPKTVERFTFEANRQPSAEHNSCGRLIRHDDTAGTREIPGYDLHGQPLGETRRFLNQLHTPSWPQELPLREQLLGSERFTSSDRFSPTGEQLEKIDARGNCQLHQYNLSGQPNQIKLRLFKGSEQTVLSEIRYSALGQMESETAGNGVISLSEYCPEDGRLSRLASRHPAHPVLQDLSYDHDPVGNIVRIEDAALTTRYFNNQQTPPESTYCYNTLYQLIKSTGRESCLPTPGACLPDYQPLPPDPTQMANYVQTFDYDKGGNLRKLVHVGARQYSRHMSTAPESNRSLPVPVDGSEPDFSASFDLNGNLKRLQAGPEMDWDLRNQLQEVTLVCRPDGANDREQYVYDGGGQRVRKITSTEAKNVSHIAEVLYLRDLEIRTNSASNEILHVINVHTGRGSVRVLHWESPPPQNVDNDQLRYGLSDHLGSSALELDESAQVLSREGYYPYGGTAWFAARSETEGKYKTIRYSGKERDVSGLYYYGFRYYISWWARWLNPDPAGNVDGLNFYMMVGNNPVSRADSNGLVGRPVGPPPIPGRPSSTFSSAPLVPQRPMPPAVRPITTQGSLVSAHPQTAQASRDSVVPINLPSPNKIIEVGIAPVELSKIKDISSSFETWVTTFNDTDWLVLKDYSSMVAFDTHGLSKQRIGASNEVFAYRFSETLNLNIVPATIIRPGEDRHVLSRYIQPNTGVVKFDRRESSMYVFDFLLNTRDRIDDGRHGNIVFDQAGSAFAIDHDQILEPGFSAIDPSGITDQHLSFFTIGQSTKERMINTDWGAFFDKHALQTPLINREQAKAEFLGRIHIVSQRLMAG